MITLMNQLRARQSGLAGAAQLCSPHWERGSQTSKSPAGLLGQQRSSGSWGRHGSSCWKRREFDNLSGSAHGNYLCYLGLITFLT